MSKLSFVIVNYNTKKVTEECIESIFNNEYLKNMFYEVIVVDNNSFDESVDYLKKKFSRNNNLKIVGNKENLGFGKANNCGVNASEGDILVFLNSDTIVKDTNFISLVSLIDDSIGFLSCKILNKDESIQSLGYEYPSVKNDFKLSLLFWNFNFVKRFRFKNYNNQGLKKVDWVSGCFMMCQKEDFIKIGGFDPKIFMYSEDIDICRRMESLKKSNYIFDYTSIYHLHGKSDSSNKNMYKKLMKNKMNYYYVMKKHNMKNIRLIKFLNTIHIILLVFLKKISSVVS